MDFKGAVRARAIGAPVVTEFIGDRAYWTQRVQSEGLPALVMQVISDPRPQHLKGFNDLRETRVQADCLAMSSESASALAEAAIAAFVPAAITNGINFNRAYVDDVQDLGEQTDLGFVHRSSIDIRFFWQTEQE